MARGRKMESVFGCGPGFITSARSVLGCNELQIQLIASIAGVGVCSVPGRSHEDQQPLARRAPPTPRSLGLLLLLLLPLRVFAFFEFHAGTPGKAPSPLLNR